RLATTKCGAGWEWRTVAARNAGLVVGIGLERGVAVVLASRATGLAATAARAPPTAAVVGTEDAAATTLVGRERPVTVRAQLVGDAAAVDGRARLASRLEVIAGRNRTAGLAFAVAPATTATAGDGATAVPGPAVR